MELITFELTTLTKERAGEINLLSAQLGIPRGSWPSFPERPRKSGINSADDCPSLCLSAARKEIYAISYDSSDRAHFPSPRIDPEIHQFRRQYRYADRNARMDGWIETMNARKVVVADPILSAVRFNVVRGILPSPPLRSFPRSCRKHLECKVDYSVLVWKLGNLHRRRARIRYVTTIVSFEWICINGLSWKMKYLYLGKNVITVDPLY